MSIIGTVETYWNFAEEASTPSLFKGIPNTRSRSEGTRRGGRWRREWCECSSNGEFRRTPCRHGVVEDVMDTTEPLGGGEPTNNIFIYARVGAEVFKVRGLLELLHEERDVRFSEAGC
ncbi:hypothetical protein PIB30_068272 [Stylosanthes scabra]|uniref:SWIM-type domain-containing protein n=1 Tax=Stylosanthes scabra TaxID=79078 RepID=A0ABU6ZLL0_9FABA|nr:hypothetical protein [Stylosanthes scabra]